MHHHTGSSSSATRIYTNPLNIRGLDGSDWVATPYLAPQKVAVRKPRYERSPERDAVSAKLCDENSNTLGVCKAQSFDASSSPMSLPTAQSGSPLKPTKEELMMLLETNLAESQARRQQKQAGHSPASTTNDEDIDSKHVSNLGISMSPDPFEPLLKLDLGNNDPLSLNFNGLSLSRKPTITSRSSDSRTGPSKSPELVERMRSLRSSDRSTPISTASLSTDDRVILERATSKRVFSYDSINLDRETLPSSILKLIGMSPSVEWPEASDLDEIDSIKSTEEFTSVGANPAALSTKSTAQAGSGNESTTAQSPQSDIQPLKPRVKSPATPTNRPSSMPSISSLQKELKSTSPRESDKAINPMPMTSSLPVTPIQDKHENLQMDGQASGSSNLLTPVVEQLPTIADLDPVLEDDRGRLFLCIEKLTNIKNLPLDSERNPRFSIVLDNGVQTVTTPSVVLNASSELTAHSARIGQEFELIVGKDLELVITIQLAMDALQPPPRPRALCSPKSDTASSFEDQREHGLASSPSKQTPIKRSKVKEFLSPRRRKVRQEAEIAAEQAKDKVSREKQIYEQAIQLHNQRRKIWSNIVSADGEFARGYLFESHYEREIFGRAQKFHLPLYSEWANGTPDHVADLQISMMYVPKFFGSERLPESLALCQAALRQAAMVRNQRFQGFLSQIGGDCVMWRRRWFSTHRNELRGYHEQSRKLRTVIHLENLAQVVDARDICGDDDTCFIFKDRSFRLVFNDGEQVNFYADSVEYKQQWMEALRGSAAVGGRSRCWTDVVLDRRDYESGASGNSSSTSK